MSKRVKNVLVACIIVSIVIFLGTRYWENDYMEEAVNAAVDTAIKLIAGETVDATIPVEVTLITQENAE